MIAVIAGLSMGLSSWLHCVGMCGPVSSMVVTSSGTTSMRDISAYHAGRVATYIILGLGIGAAGDAVRLSLIAINVTVVTGIVLIGAAIMQLAGIHARIPYAIAERIRPLTQAAFRRSRTLPGPVRFLVFGAANGLLPCGVSLTAVLAAATLPSFVDRVGFLAAFGVTTVPALLSVNLVLHRVSEKWRDRFQRMTALSLLVLGGLVVLRGLSLGIPLVSPRAHHAGHHHSGCCTVQSSERSIDNSGWGL